MSKNEEVGFASALRAPGRPATEWPTPTRIRDAITSVVNDYGQACIVADSEDTRSAHDHAENLYDRVAAALAGDEVWECICGTLNGPTPDDERRWCTGCRFQEPTVVRWGMALWETEDV
jgi:hypothetical protein